MSTRGRHCDPYIAIGCQRMESDRGLAAAAPPARSVYGPPGGSRPSRAATPSTPPRLRRALPRTSPGDAVLVYIIL